MGLSCLSLAIIFFRFKTQIFILLNRLAKFEFRITKNLQYTDQDFEPESPNTDQDFKPELPNLSWITLTREKFAVRFVIFVILSTLIYIVFNSVSGVLVQLGNIEFSAGNEKLGIASYNLALEFNRDLKEAISQCNADNSYRHQYELAISDCSEAIEIDEQLCVSAYSNRGTCLFEV